MHLPIAYRNLLMCVCVCADIYTPPSTDMRDYEFQLHLCSSVYDSRHRYCTKEEGEIAFELRQTGTWLLLDRVNCRCLGVADIARYGYSKGVLPSDTVFRGNYLQMTCAKKVCR